MDSLKLIPALSEKEIADMQEWIKGDKEYEGAFRRMKERLAEELRAVRDPERMAWWERDRDGIDVNPNVSLGARRRGREGFDVRYPKARKDRDGRERKRAGRREGLRL
jgi:SWI/SNF-related matrix-associated actin-dependent regulator of chromatin subfamily B protein 1